MFRGIVHDENVFRQYSNNLFKIPVGLWESIDPFQKLGSPSPSRHPKIACE